MKIIEGTSHLDHSLTADHIALISKRFAERAEFFVETFELPAGMPEVPCGLHGPATGDGPVPDAECVMEVRGNRKGPSRLCNRAPKPSRLVTVIAGPHEGNPCVLYTAFGGPVAPREPWDPSIQGDPALAAASVAFWATHALSR